MKMTVETAKTIAAEMAYSDYRIHAGVERKAVVKEWTRGAEKRTYIKIYCYTMAGNYKGNYDCGYIDQDDNYHPGEINLAETTTETAAETTTETAAETTTETAAEPTTEPTTEPTGRFVAKVAVTDMLAEPDPNAVMIVGELDKLIDEMQQKVESLSDTLVGYLRELLSRRPDCLFSESDIREMASDRLAEKDELEKDLDTIQRVRNMYECAMGGIMSQFWFDGDTYEPTVEEKGIINKHYIRFEYYNRILS